MIDLDTGAIDSLVTGTFSGSDASSNDGVHEHSSASTVALATKVMHSWL
jgi:hypothetical protein